MFDDLQQRLDVNRKFYADHENLVSTLDKKIKQFKASNSKLSSKCVQLEKSISETVSCQSSLDEELLKTTTAVQRIDGLISYFKTAIENFSY